MNKAAARSAVAKEDALIMVVLVCVEHDEMRKQQRYAMGIFYVYNLMKNVKLSRREIS